MRDSHAFSRGGLSESQVCFGKAGIFQVKRISVESK